MSSLCHEGIQNLFDAEIRKHTVWPGDATILHFFKEKFGSQLKRPKTEVQKRLTAVAHSYKKLEPGGGKPSVKNHPLPDYAKLLAKTKGEVEAFHNKTIEELFHMFRERMMDLIAIRSKPHDAAEFDKQVGVFLHYIAKQCSLSVAGILSEGAKKKHDMDKFVLDNMPEHTEVPGYITSFHYKFASIKDELHKDVRALRLEIREKNEKGGLGLDANGEKILIQTYSENLFIRGWQIATNHLKLALGEMRKVFGKTIGQVRLMIKNLPMLPDDKKNRETILNEKELELDLYIESKTEDFSTYPLVFSFIVEEHHTENAKLSAYERQLDKEYRDFTSQINIKAHLIFNELYMITFFPFDEAEQDHKPAHQQTGGGNNARGGGGKNARRSQQDEQELRGLQEVPETRAQKRKKELEDLRAPAKGGKNKRSGGQSAAQQTVAEHEETGRGGKGKKKGSSQPSGDSQEQPAVSENGQRGEKGNSKRNRT